MRWIRGFLVGILVLVLTAIWGMACADTWDGTALDTSWYDASQDEFHISTAAQLAGVAALVNDGTADFSNKTISLEEDIDLGSFSWTPIGNYEHEFQGIFNGNDHAITNLFISKYSTDSRDQKYTGFFTSLSDAAIKNLTLQGEITCGATVEFVGGFCAEASNVTIENCTGNISFGDSVIYYAGGFVSAAEDVTLLSCNNQSDIALGTSLGVGGMIGYAAAGNITISDCVNDGDISSYFYTAGGFVAESTADSITITSSVNNGDVTLTLTYSSQSGGFIGYNKKGTADISYCVNTGKITGADAGGIAARNTVEYTQNLASIKIENCMNQGDISVNKAYSYQVPNAGGGIMGWSLNAQIDHCINLGTIYASDYSYSFCGGIAGDNYSADIINCANYGNITGSALWAGGIAGASHYPQQSIVSDGHLRISRILNCYNSGDVYSSGSSGGIVGTLGMSDEEEKAIVDNSYSCGEISATTNTNVAGIAGKLFFGTITNSYYLKTSNDLRAYSYGTDGVATTDILKNVGYIEEIQDRTNPDVYLSDFIYYEYDDSGNAVASPVRSDEIILNALKDVMLQKNGYMPWVIAQDHNDFYPVFGMAVTFVIKPNGDEGYEEVNTPIAAYNHADYSLPEHTYYFADTDIVEFTAQENPGYKFKEAIIADGERFISNWTENGNQFSFKMGAFPVEIELWYEEGNIQVTVYKIWNDADNIDHIRPTRLSITLALNDAEITDANGDPATVILGPAGSGSWQHTFELPSGDYRRLAVWEGSIDGYYREGTYFVPGENEIQIVVMNKHVHVAAEAEATNESMVNIQYEVTKTWDDTKAAGTVVHPEITVLLYADGEYVASGTIAADADPASCKFENLPKYKDNDSDELINYTIVEEINDENWVKTKDEATGKIYWYSTDGIGKYSASVSGATITADTLPDSAVEAGITNTYDILQSLIDVEVTKLWKDHENENGVRPQSIKLGLFKTASDTAPVKEVELSNPSGDSADNKAASWSGKFTDLPLYDGAARIDYTTYVVILIPNKNFT